MIKYDLKGTYVSDDIKGSRSLRGGVNLYDNGMIYGDVIRQAPKRGEIQTAFFGVIYGDGSLGLIDIPELKGIRPGAWFLKPNGQRNSGLSGEYRGVWGFSDRGSLNDAVNLLSQGGRRFSGEEISASSFSSDRMKAGLFQQAFFAQLGRGVEENVEEPGQKASFEFTERKRKR